MTREEYLISFCQSLIRTPSLSGQEEQVAKLIQTTMLENGFAPSDESDTPEQSSLRNEQRRALERAIANLPEDMRAAIVLRDVQGCSYDEIAQALDTNVGTIKSRISRGREKLRAVLTEQPELFGRHPV